MGTVQVFTADRMLDIENSSIVDGSVVGDNLILEKKDGTPVDAGNVRGPQGTQGIPGIQGTPGLDAAFVVRASDPGVNLTLSGTQTIDGVALVAGDWVLAKNQTTPANNGIWVVAAGAWSRPAAADSSAELAGAMVRVQAGTNHGGTRWVTTFKSTDTLNTTAMSWYRELDGSNVVTFTAGGTTNSTGFITITHGLPWTPSQVFHSNGNPSASFAVLWGVESIGASTFSARFMNASTAGALNALNIGVARWTCHR